MSKRKISSILKGDARLENETYEEFKLRRKAEKLLLKKYLKGTPVDIEQNVPKENLTSWK
jgi:hypothetical protein|tara:strand:+ start:163 stop:342 length:180 start_codon:yes stop_codon:yes gene_type:complete